MNYIYIYVNAVVKHHQNVFLRYYVGFNYYSQWQRGAEENAELRGTIERDKEQIAEMSKQLG